MVRALLRGLAICAALAIALPALSAELAGKVVGVLDGDTIDVLTPAKELVRVRLAGIDAPEKKQAFGNTAKQKLSDLAFSRNVVVDWQKRDRYGRIVGKVLIAGIDVDLEMVKAGLAWHYRKYMKEQPMADRLSYMQAETVARERRLGLWSDSMPVPPWEFRRPTQNH